MGKSVAKMFQQADQLPDHLVNGAGLGNENVSADNMQIPRLDLIQQLSPQCVKSNPKYIEGAECGHIFDSLTGQLYDKVFLINLLFEETYSCFKKRNLGGGFEGNFDTIEAAHEHLGVKGLDVNQYDISKTAIHKCLMLDENGVPKQPVLIYMNGSKLRVSDQWNSLIALENKTADRFASVWLATSITETNKQNQPYQNWKMKFAGFVSPELYEEAKKIYLSLTSKAQTAANDG